MSDYRLVGANKHTKQGAHLSRCMYPRVYVAVIACGVFAEFLNKSYDDEDGCDYGNGDNVVGDDVGVADDGDDRDEYHDERED